MILIPMWLFILLAAFGCWGILVFINAIRNRNIKVVSPSASHNSVRDVICPTCRGAGFTPNIFDSKIKVPCILCNESGKLHP